VVVAVVVVRVVGMRVVVLMVILSVVVGIAGSRRGIIVRGSLGRLALGRGNRWRRRCSDARRGTRGDEVYTPLQRERRILPRVE
jgi:UPF0716 family protein affecting phage T7 exclusion